MIEELMEKWQDVLDHTEDFTERTLCEEFLADMKELRKYLD